MSDQPKQLPPEIQAKLQTINMAQNILIAMLQSPRITIAEDPVAEAYRLAQLFEDRAREMLKPPTILAPPQGGLAQFPPRGKQ